MNGHALLAAVAAPVVAILTLTGGLTVVLGGAGAAACTTTPSQPASSTSASAAAMPTAEALHEGWMPTVAGFDAAQVHNAARIVAVGSQLGVPVRGWIIAVATAIQESSLRNLHHGDVAGPDSLGLFQQRDAWGTRAARLNPDRAARMFFLGGNAGQDGLLDLDDWQTMPLIEVAQAVQRSAHPDAYAAQEDDATRLVAAITGNLAVGGVTSRSDALTCAQPSGPGAAQAVAFARQQLGVPYKWGGDGPFEGGFDCSGLTHAAYAAAGIDLPRTAQTQYDTGPLLPADAELLPGDLVFYGTSPDHITHVGIYTGNQQMIDAPHRGAVVRIENYQWRNYLAASRPTA